MNERTKRIFLKPCPICGSAPEQKSYQCDPWGDGAGYVKNIFYKCSGCGYITTAGCLDTYGKGEESAKKQWNYAVNDIEELLSERGYKKNY